MMKITVLKEMENGNYEVNFNLDGENLGNREMSYESIRADVVGNNTEVEYDFEIDMRFDHIELDEEEGEGFIYIVNTLATEEGIFTEEEQKVYKTFKGAEKAAHRLAYQMQTILKNLAC